MQASKVSSTDPEATRSTFIVFVFSGVVPPADAEPVPDAPDAPDVLDVSDDPIVPSLAQPPTSNPNKAITANALTDRSAMMRPFLQEQQ